MRTAVAIALYNGKRFLKEQIDSLLAQTKVPDLIVCCDDGSSDGTMDWLENYVQENRLEELFCLIRNESNLGYVQNFYKALDLCDADVLFLCDQDDIWHAEKIERMCKVMEEKPECALLSCSHDLIDADGASITSLRYSQKSSRGDIRAISEKEIVTLFLWPGMTMALRRSFWNEIQADARAISAPHDRVLSLMAASRDAMFFLDIPLCSHRLHTSNSGGEEDSIKAVLGREFKIKELSTSLKWLDAQLACANAFSSAAIRELRGYREYVASRLTAVQKRSPLLLMKALRCKGYVHLKGIAADLLCILRNK